jgi:hypothetical protein
MTSGPASRQRARRSRLREQGLRPVQLWVPDTRAPAVAERIGRQCRALAADPQEAEVLEWLEAAAGFAERT